MAVRLWSQCSLLEDPGQLAAWNNGSLQTVADPARSHSCSCSTLSWAQNFGMNWARK
jgi:hypothetical protein